VLGSVIIISGEDGPVLIQLSASNLYYIPEISGCNSKIVAAKNVYENVSISKNGFNLLRNTKSSKNCNKNCFSSHQIRLDIRIKSKNQK
jgi:hypothetical protein